MRDIENINKDYRLEIKVKNNNILKKIEDNGYSSVYDFCKKNEKPAYQSTVGEFVNLKRTPFNPKGEYHPCVIWMAKILKCTEEDLFSDHQMSSFLKSNKKTIEIGEAEAIHALAQKEQFLLPDELLERKQNEKITNNLLRTLDNREEQILRLRFGFDDANCLTLDQIGQKFGITATRVREIEARALQKLRHPSRAYKFEE